MILEKLFGKFTDNYENYDSVNWRTFRLDDRIWNRSGFMQPDIVYYRQLQKAYEQMLSEMSESYLYDFEAIKQAFDETHARNCQLERDLAIASGTIDILKSQLESAIKWQTATGRKNEVLSSSGYQTEEVVEQPKELKSQKFQSNNGNSRKENIKLAAAMSEAGKSNSEIAEKIGVSETTIKAYVSTAKKHYTIIDNEDGRTINFDKEYDNTVTFLDIYNE